jgi:citrate lyase beta subunit
MTYRRRRSMLFVPGDDPKKIAKAAQSDADCIILELEDGVAVNRKADARTGTSEALHMLDFGARERVVRVNALSTPFFQEDVLRTIPARPNAVLVPKVDSADDVHTICATLRTVESAHALLPVPLMIMVESALGVMNLREICTADSRLVALIFGAEDYAGSVGVQRSRTNEEVLFARSAVVTAAAAYDLQAIDMVCPHLDDNPAFEAECQQGRALGYAGKTLIHPKQIYSANRVFSPTTEEVARARRVVEAFVAHQAEGKGAFTLDGKMIDAPIIRQAERVLASAGGKAE